jgi:hypothetical protein
LIVDRPTLGDTADNSTESTDIAHQDQAFSYKVTEQPPHVPDIPTPEVYRAVVDAQYRKHAIEQGCARVREIEENVVTPAMLRIESADPSRRLVGLDHRLKGEDRLSEKVEFHLRASPDITYDEAFAKVKDAVRFTFEYKEAHYAEGVIADCTRLEEAGFKRVDLRNTWANEEYKGINSRWRIPESGQLFEIQFHTRSSFEAKQETHQAYEKIRDPATSKSERDELIEYQREVSARIPIPPGAPGIPNCP